MDFDRLIEFSGRYLSEYVNTFVATLAHPSRRFSPPPAGGSQEIIVAVAPEEVRGSHLSPKLLTFVVISIIIGVTINASIPGRPPGPDLLPSLLIILISWVGFGVVSHWTALLIGGRGSFWETLSVSLQLLAVIYVISCFVSLLAGAITKVEMVRILVAAKGGGLEVFVKDPVLVYFLSQLVLMMMYLPLAFKHVHGLKWVQQLLVSLFVPVTTLVGLLTYVGIRVVGGG
jgi:hypothetical protein